jgi:hypothetical protein
MVGRGPCWVDVLKSNKKKAGLFPTRINVGIRRVECASLVHSTDNLDVGVSPRKVNCWQKVWGGLIPTYESTFSDLFVRISFY